MKTMNCKKVQARAVPYYGGTTVLGHMHSRVLAGMVADIVEACK